MRSPFHRHKPRVYKSRAMRRVWFVACKFCGLFSHHTSWEEARDSALEHSEETSNGIHR